MNGKIKRLEVNTDLKMMALSFIEAIERLESPFVFPVIGDFIVDRYRYCKVERKNLEHDSLIHDLMDASCFYGGAANVANILGTFSRGSINKRVDFFLGCGKNDPRYLQRINLFDPETFRLNVYCDPVYEKVIPVKTRYIGLNRNEYLFRVDSEPTRSEFTALSDDVVYHMSEDIGRLDSDVLFISDYNKGFISEQFLEYLDDNSNVKHRYCNIRPKRVTKYINRMHLLSFNKTEFIQAYEVLFDELLDVIAVDNILRLKDKLGVPNVIITFGSNGFIFCGEHDCCTKVDAPKNLSVGSKNIIGAGDMISASFAFFDAMNFHFFLENWEISAILYLVNCSAFLKVYTGDYTVSFDLLKSYINGNLLLF